MPERKSQQMLEMPEETVPQKFKNLRTIARAAAYNPEFRAYIFNRAHVAGYNDMRRDAPAFFRLLAGDFIYTPEVGEFYQYPLHFARAPLGDCDDQTIYLAAAADVIGIPNEFILIADVANRELLHVFLRAWTPDELNIDNTLPGKPLAVRPIAWISNNRPEKRETYV